MRTEDIPSTTERVQLHTNPEINDRIRRDTLAKIAYYQQHKEEIDDRLKELDREWDTERLLETNAGTVAMIGVVLGFARSKSWFFLPGLVGFFLLQHAIQGWCTPLLVIRRLGFRNAGEIHGERIALQRIKGEIRGVRKSPAAAVSAAAGR